MIRSDKISKVDRKYKTSYAYLINAYACSILLKQAWRIGTSFMYKRSLTELLTYLVISEQYQIQWYCYNRELQIIFKEI